MTFLYQGTGRFEDAAEMAELKKQRIARDLSNRLSIADAWSCIGNRQIKPGWTPLRPRRPGEPYAGSEASN